MRATVLLMLFGVLFLAACTPAAETATSTATPTAAALQGTQTPREEQSPTATIRVPTATVQSQPPATLDGRALLQERCTVCHSLARVESASKTADQWRTTVNRMVGKGAVLTAEELEALVQYLATTYP